MRILYLLPHVNMTIADPVGHAIRIRGLIGGFRQLGADVVVISAGDQRMDRTAKTLYRSLVKGSMPARLSGALRDIFCLMNDRLFRGRAYRLASARGPFDLVVEHFSFLSEAGVYVARRLNLPLILDDIPPIWEDELYYRRELPRAARFIQARAFGQATGLIAVSGVIRDYLIGSQVPAERIHVVHNGADCSRFHPGVGGNEIREKYGLQKGPVVGFVGSFAPWHGLDFLLGCADGLADTLNLVRFLIVGDGDRRLDLERQVESSGLSGRITFTGARPYEEIPSLIDAMDIGVMPDSNSYGSPIKIFEYMAMGKAVIAPRLAPIEEIVTDGKDGILFPPKNQVALREAIVELCRNVEYRIRLGRCARQKVLDHFTWKRHAEAIITAAGHDARV
jgi:glycosyltransferase involved in cell wall biosynthesis